MTWGGKVSIPWIGLRSCCSFCRFDWNLPSGSSFLWPVWLVKGETGQRLGGERGVVHSAHSWPPSYDRIPSLLYNAGTEHVGFSPTRQILLAPSPKRREVLNESHEG